GRNLTYMNQELLYFPGSENILSVPPNMLLLVVRLKRVAHWDETHSWGSDDDEASDDYWHFLGRYE
ncbi:hypothetical protein, partial [Hyella patelloides]